MRLDQRTGISAQALGSRSNTNDLRNDQLWHVVCFSQLALKSAVRNVKECGIDGLTA